MNVQEAAYQPSHDVKQIQQQKLQQLLHYLSLHSPFYKKLFAKHNIDITTIKKPEDLVPVPITTKDDLQNSEDFLCVDKKHIIEYTSTSGTLGSPVSIALTENDLQRLALNEYNSFVTADCSANDTFQLMLTLDRQFMAGIAYYSGIRKLGGRYYTAWARCCRLYNGKQFSASNQQ